MKKIEKSIELNASPEKVWKVLTEDHYVRQWYVPFMEGSYAETDWKQGSKVVFKDGAGSGMIGHIIENVPNKSLVVEFDGMMINNKEDYESKEAREAKGQKEAYRLTSNGNTTRLDVETGMTEEMYDMISVAWDKALQLIKRLAES